MQFSMPPGALLDRLSHWAKIHPQNPALLFLAEGERVQDQLDYATLSERVNALAAWLVQRVSPGSRVLLAPHSELNYLLGLLACLRAGVIAIPTLATMNARALERIHAHGEDAGASALLADPWILERRDRSLGSDGKASTWLQAIPWLNMEDAFGEVEPPSAPATAAPVSGHDTDRVAYLQYTSGSTSRAKGVMVTLGNLAAQLGGLERVLDHRPGSVVCNWMPLYHDFGLVMSLQALYSGGTLVLMPAVPTVQRPQRWLQAISDYRAVTSAAPNFMFDRCVERIAPSDLAGLDLSGLHHLLNAAEPIQPSSLRSFTEHFRSQGYRGSAWMPAYGLAEATLLASMSVPGAGFLVDKFDADALLEQRATAPVDEASGKELVGCGVPLVAGSIRIVEPDTGRPSAVGAIGEVWVSSPSVAAGYWQRANESTETFGTRLPAPDDALTYLRTGDLGFLWKDQLFIAGRLKDLIIVRGENHYPQDIEFTVAQCHPDLEPNAGAAFAIDDAHGERLVVVQEVRREVLQRFVKEDLFAAIRHAVAENHGLDSAHIILLRPTGLPRTSSGKVQRRACRQAWQAGLLPIVAEWRAMGPSPSMPAAKALSLEQEILLICRRLLNNELIEQESSLFDYGVDSLKAAEILLALEERWKVVMDLADFAEHSSVALLARNIRGRIRKPAPVKAEQPFFRGDQTAESQAEPTSAAGLIAQIRHYVASWEGERLAPDSLLVGRNTRGKNCPLFWVFQGQQEFSALADRLGPEQPVYGLRSGHQVMEYSEANIQALATSYRRAIAAVHPHGPYLLGGNCQGGLIALAIAQQLWRLQQPVALLSLLEWAFPPQPYQGRVALFWGESSWQKNPYFRFNNPELYWQRAFGAHTVDIVSGGHGQFFSEPNLDVLADKLLARLRQAVGEPPLLLATADCRAEIRAINPPLQLAPGETAWLRVEIRNLGAVAWASSERSGLQLGNHWLDNEQQVARWLDGAAPLPALDAGASSTVRLAVRAPTQSGRYFLQLDLAEEGVAWFSERGHVAPLLPITVVG